MSIPLSCPSCRYRFAVPDHSAGKQGKCPKCGEVLTAPSSAPVAATIKPKPKPAVEADEPTSPADVSIRVDHAPTHRRARAAKKKNPALMIGIGAGGALLAIVVIVVAVIAGWETGREEQKPSVAANPRGQSPRTRPRGKTDRVLSTNDSRERSSGDFQLQTAAATSAKSFQEVLRAIVKIETPLVEGGSLGTGFIINDKGWIATNWHVVESATSQTVAVTDAGASYAIEGLVAKAPEHDLAILKLAERPFQLTTLDISYSQQPAPGAEVFAYGHPHGEKFSLSRGIVSKVAISTDLSRDSQAFLFSRKLAGDRVWIQHEAKIAPGNSGGPLFLADGRVVGINTWVSPEFGYAGHVDALRELVAKAGDTVTPFKPGVASEIAEIDQAPPLVTAERLEQLVEYCGKFQFTPTSREHDNSLSELAKIITLARNSSRASASAKSKADAVCDVFSKMAWSKQTTDAINKFAAEATNKPLHGMIFVATVREAGVPLGSQKVDQLQIEGAGKFVIVACRDDKPLAEKGKRVLVVGMNTGAALSFPGLASQRLLLLGYSLELPAP
jgi:S1-C subfamily serine protease